MKTILKILLAAFVLSLVPATHVCAQGKKWSYQGIFSEGMSMVIDANDKCGFIDGKSKLVIPCQWKGAGSFSEGSAFVIDDNGKRVMIDKTGKIIK